MSEGKLSYSVGIEKKGFKKYVFLVADLFAQICSRSPRLPSTRKVNNQ